MIHQVKYRIRGEDLILETGRMAKQANGAVLATYGGSAVLATVCCSANRIEGIDYVPLMVDYNEKHYAAGKIPGGFLKREGRPKDKEILVSRLIDRPLRPLFHKEFGRDIQLIPTTLATDKTNPPDVLGIISACAAVHISDIPFEGPVAAVRIAALNGDLIINPTFKETEEAELEIIVAGTVRGITMVEGGGKEVSEDLMLSAIDRGHAVIKDLCDLQNELRRLAGLDKLPLPDPEPALDNEQEYRSWIMPKLEAACFVRGKMERATAIKQVRTQFLEEKGADLPKDQLEKVGSLFEDAETEVVRNSILERGIRTDGRGPDEIRPITCEIDVLPRTHGAALFTRGETQALVVTTLGTPYDEQRLDNLEGDSRKNFMLHYNFPPFSVGETGRLGTGRREIGHGALAERSIERVLPSKEDFGYTIRVVSEILESNGSSSMATVCGSTLSLLSAGVPISQPVAGIAMGLITAGGKHVVLSDILGEEDHLGDMDFKVAGTKDGITAFQMDIKIAGVDAEILKTALLKAREGRLYILSIMNQTIERPRSETSEYAPKMVTLKIDTDKIGAVIGPGGKNINRISETSEAKVSIEDDGSIQIFSQNKAGAEKAKEMIMALIEEPEVGKIYQGVVKRLMDFGAFVEFMPGREGLVHISKLSREHVEQVSDVLSLDQAIPVRLIEIDRMGRLNLSYVDALDGGEGADWSPPPRSDGDRQGGDHGGGGRPRPPRSSGGDRGGDRGGRGGESRRR